jgi:cellulose synthase/poly-beta-1,6-N-acetylglucosamine synthase-like glycosyltransferase
VTRALFWISTGLLAWTQAGYGLLLALLSRDHDRDREPEAPQRPKSEPFVTLVVAAYREEAVIADKVANALALDWPRDRLEVLVAVDGAGEDDTAARARAAGADVVLELPRGGKMRSQDAAVRQARGDVIAFSDANAMWEPGALRALAAAFDDPGVAYACGNVTFLAGGGTNQEGVYWRYEMWMRARESALHSITAGNGAIYAVRRSDYVVYEPPMGHDLSFPFAMVKKGRRAVYVPDARATERMVPTIEGEWRRKRRMMVRAWEIMRVSGIADPRGYPPLYALMIASHRVLRYASPFLHVLALLTALALARRPLYRAALAAQLALVAAAAAGGRIRARPLLVARYYVLTTAAIAAGLYDQMRHGTPAGWEPAEGTR